MALQLVGTKAKKTAPAAVPVTQQLAELRAECDDLARQVEAVDIRAREIPALIAAGYEEWASGETDEVAQRIGRLNLEAGSLPARRAHLCRQLAEHIEQYHALALAEAHKRGDEIALRMRVMVSEIDAIETMLAQESNNASQWVGAQRAILQRAVETQDMDPLQAYRQYRLATLPVVPAAN
jgi:hypothetical protein